MSSRLLIVLDGSPEGSAALELGLRWARRLDATLVGLAVVDEPSIRRPEPVPIGGTHFKRHAEEERLREARAKADALLADFEKRCALAGTRLDVLEEFGSPPERVLADASRCDLVLLGRGAAEEAILRRASRPVVAVPRHLPEGEAVLAAYDGSERAARALQAFRWFHEIGAGPVHVLSVHPDGNRAADQARMAVDYLRGHAVPAVERIVASSAPPGEVILRVAREFQAGLIVMGAYGRPRLREFLLGSVTRSLLRESSIPLFLDH